MIAVHSGRHLIKVDGISTYVEIDGHAYWPTWLIDGDDPENTTKVLTLIKMDRFSGSSPSLRGAWIIDVTPKILGLIEKHISVFDDPFCHETNKHGITMVSLGCPYEEEK